jgi:hypothetical protein
MSLNVDMLLLECMGLGRYVLHERVERFTKLLD